MAKPIPALAFESAAVPTVDETPNPFAEVVAALAANWDETENRSAEAKSVVIPDDDVNRLTQRLREAVKATGLGLRTKVTPGTVKGTTVLTFWLRPKRAVKTTPEQA